MNDYDDEAAESLESKNALKISVFQSSVISISNNICQTLIFTKSK